MANYGNKGWVKLWRSDMIENPFYDNGQKSFDLYHAWIDLCLMADSSGTVKTSLEALKNRWFWGSTHKVRDYLDTVQGMGLGTVTKIPNKGTLIRINTRKIKKMTKDTTDVSGTVSGTDSVTEELLSKEVGMASHEVSQPIKKNKITLNELQNELGDDYE